MHVELLSRVQFAFTIAFHYLFPPLTIGLGVALIALSLWGGLVVVARVPGQP